MLKKLIAVSVLAGLMAGTCFAAWPQTSETRTINVSMSAAEFQRQIGDANSQLNQILSQYNISGAGVSVSPYRLVAPNRAEATIRSSYFGSTYTIIVINTPSGGSASSSAITANRVLRNSVLSQASPRGDQEEQQRTRMRGGFRADAFYSKWKTEDGGGADGDEGSVAGINPCITFGSDKVEFAVTIPIHVSTPDPDSDQEPTYHGGVDLMFKAWLGRFVSMGVHASYMASVLGASNETSSESEAAKMESDVNGGPFVSFRIPMGRAGVLSLAALFENYYHINNDDSGADSEIVSELALAANLGFYIGNFGAVNFFGVEHVNLDTQKTEGAGAEDSNSDYGEVGAELQLGRGTWSLSVGARTVVGVENYSSVEGYLGTNWRW